MPVGTQVVLTEDLWFEDGADADAEEVAAQSMVAMSAKIVGLHPFHSVAQKIIQMTQDPDCKVKNLADVIEKDPPFAVRTLRLVHSAAFALPVRCTSISQAVGLLGIKAIGEMASSWAVLDMFNSHKPLWLQLKEHAILVAGLARLLARKLSLPADDVYTCGLMHDLGKLFLLQDADEGYSPLLEPSLSLPDALHEAERQAYGYDHAVLAAQVLKTWAIPEPVPHVVAWHHQPARAYAIGGEIANIVGLIRLANRIAYAIKKAGAREESLPELAAGTDAEHVNLTPEELEMWWPELVMIADEVELVMVAEKERNLNPAKTGSKPNSSGIQPLNPLISNKVCVQCGQALPLSISSHSNNTALLCANCSTAAEPAMDASQPARTTTLGTSYIVWGAIGGIILLIVVLILLMK